MEKINEIEQHPVYQQVMADSFGGIMYNVANRGKYDLTELMPMWDDIPGYIQEAAGGVMQGAFRFLKGE